MGERKCAVNRDNILLLLLRWSRMSRRAIATALTSSLKVLLSFLRFFLFFFEFFAAIDRVLLPPFITQRNTRTYPSKDVVDNIIETEAPSAVTHTQTHTRTNSNTNTKTQTRTR